MKKVFIMLSLVFVLAILAACGKDDDTTTAGQTTTTAGQTTTTAGQTTTTDDKTPNPNSNTRYITYNLGTDSQTWDPSFNSAADGGHIINNMFEGLFRGNLEGVALAGATSYELSTDLKTYTFHLRQDAKWSNGEPVTSQDYKFAWLRVMDPIEPSDYSYIMDPLIVNGTCYLNGECEASEVGIETPDTYTLVVHLNNPVPYFLHLLSFYTYMPVYSGNGALEAGWEKEASTAISNGPFKFTNYTPGEIVQLDKNEHYWNAENVRIKGIKFVIVDDANTALTSFNQGSIEVLDQVPINEISNLLANSPYFKIVADIGTYYINFNMDDPIIGTPAGENGRKIRMALSMAIDRQSIVDNVTKGGQIPAVSFVPPTLSYSDGSPCGLDIFGISKTAKINEAKALLAEAGYDTEAKLTELGNHITYGFNQTANDGNRFIAEAIQAQWKNALGIEVSLEQQEWAIFEESAQQGEYQVNRMGWLGDYPDPNTMLDLFTSYSGNNYSQWRWQSSAAFSWDDTVNPGNQAFDLALQGAMVSQGKTRDEFLRTAENILLVDEVAIMPIYHYTRMSLINTDTVDGVYQTLMGHWYFGNAVFID